MRSFGYSDLTGRSLVFLKKCSLRRAGWIRKVVIHEGLTVVFLLNVLHMYQVNCFG